MAKRLLAIFMGASMLVALFFGSAGMEVSADLFDSPVPGPPVNDDFANATGVSYIPFSDSTTIEEASLEDLEPLPECVWAPTGTIWYAFTPSESGSVMARTLYGWTFETHLGIYTGTSLDDLTEIAYSCGWGDGNSVAFYASAGETYYIQVGGNWGTGPLTFHLATPESPEVYFYYYPSPASIYSTIQFQAECWDPAGMGCETYEWDFGDGTTAEGSYPTHNYAEDGDYTVELVATTSDGRTGSTSQTVQVQTHDVAITEFRTPTRAKAGKTYRIVVGVNNRGLYDEDVYLDLYKSVPGEYDYWEWIGSASDSVPVQRANRTVDFEFSYTFTEEDAATKKVSFRAVANLYYVPDAKPADNEAISLPTMIKPLR